MTSIYNGVGPLPKNKRKPTMKEAIEAGQVRYFGLNKIDARLIKHHKDTKLTKKSKEKIINDYYKLDAKHKKLIQQLKEAKTEIEKEKIKKEGKANKIKLDEAKIKFLEVFNK